MRRTCPMVVLAVVVVALAVRPARAIDGAEIYAEACASCHGADGRGHPEGSRIAVPLPDFTDCAFVTAESSGNWAKLVRLGGPALGLSSQMPGFAAALGPDEIAAVLAHVRRFCADPAWPLGDLNFRRLLGVTKAFPEDELVLSFLHAAGPRGARETEGELELEKRIGARGRLELGIPAAGLTEDGRSTVGVGDVGLSYSHVLLAAPTTGSIVAAGAGLQLPVGNRRNGVGSGTLVAVPRVLAGQRLGPVVAQAEVDVNLPVDPDRSPREMRYALGLGVPTGPSRRAVVPAVVLEQTHGIAADVPASTLLVPQVYLPLSRSGHVACSVGGALPVAGERPFDWQLRAFLLWDWADGPFWRW